MNTRRIWSLWHELCNTNEIARKLKLKEWDVEHVVWTKMNEQHMRRKKLFREART